jgi:iron(III) transport system substrate-binding protein
MPSRPLRPGIEAAVPAALRDPEGRWLALSMRARVAYAKPGLKGASVFSSPCLTR